MLTLFAIQSKDFGDSNGLVLHTFLNLKRNTLYLLLAVLLNKKTEFVPRLQLKQASMKNFKPNGLGTCFATNVLKFFKGVVELTKKICTYLAIVPVLTPLGLIRLIFCVLLLFLLIQLNILPDYSVILIILVRDYIEKYY